MKSSINKEPLGSRLDVNRNINNFDTINAKIKNKQILNIYGIILNTKRRASMEINIQKLRSLIKSNQSLTLERNANYLYHGIFIPGFKDISPVLSIIEHGILSIHELEKIGIKIEQIRTSNGKYYICFSSDKNEFDRVFDVGFIVENGPSYIRADKNSKLTNLLWNTPIPLREGLKNEYQVLGKIAPEQIIGIQLRFDKLLKGIPDHMKISETEYVSRIIKAINAIFDKIEEKKYTIPVINANDNQIIDKDLFRKLQKCEEISTSFAHILKDIPNVGDVYETVEFIPYDYDELWDFFGCSIERINIGVEKTFIRRIKPINELNNTNTSKITSKTRN